MRRRFSIGVILFLLLGAGIPATAQTHLISCILTAEAPLLRSEGVAERIGDVRFVCSGGDPNQLYFVNFVLVLNTAITSDLTGPDPDETEALLLIDDPLPGVVNTSNGVTYNGQVEGTPGTAPGAAGGAGTPGSGNVYRGFRMPASDNWLQWNGIPFVPAPAGKGRIFRFVNVRADMTRFQPTTIEPQAITVSLATTTLNVFPIANSQVVAGWALPSMTSSVRNEEGAFELRFEEGFTTAFRKRIENTAAGALTTALQATPETFYFTESGFTPDSLGLQADAPGVADTGTRLVTQFNGLPDGVYVTAPSSATSVDPSLNPTALELRRVLNSNDDFSGGVLMASGALAELVPVSNGQATLLYEVTAQAPFAGVNGGGVIDVFRVPVQFIFAQPTGIGSPSVAMSYAPLDATTTMSGAAPEPRFFNPSPEGILFSVIAYPTLDYVTFDYTPSDPVPILHQVTFDPAAPAISSSITIVDSSESAWLSVTAATEVTSEIVTLAANPVGMAPGRYHAAVTLRVTGSENQLRVIPVVLDVRPPPEIMLDTSPLTFRVTAGSPAPEPQIRYLNGRHKWLHFEVSVSTSSGGPWLSVTPVSGNTPKNLSISANPAGLALGTFEGAVSIRSETAANSPRMIPVTLIVAPPIPIFEAAGVVNAASYLGGGVSPGELVTIFGTGAGPAQPAGLDLDQNGRVATMVGGTRILFDGVPAPIIAVSKMQSSCVAPYSLAGKSSVAVEVEVDGWKSAPVTLPVMATWPGIFTLDFTGAGQGAILNQDATVNSAENPTARDSLVVIYLTGAGQTVPAGVDGEINNPANPPLPLAAVSVKIGGIDSSVVFAGGAPGTVAGAVQVNARIDSAVEPGPAVPVEITIGEATSQPGVTVAVE